MNVFTVLDNIEKCCIESTMGVYNTVVRRLRRLLRSGIFALDSTIVETRPDFPGCGKTKRKKEGRPSDPPEYKYIYGFKVFVLYEIKSRIIVAVKIVPANEDDHKYFLPMIRQGIHNCGKNRIETVIADRGFLDGAQLWELKHRLKIDFIIPAKAGMIIREDAIALRKEYQNKPLAQWVYGKGICQGYGVDGLQSYLEYNPKGVQNNSKTNGTPLNAVVVTMWKGQAVPVEDQIVLLTSLPAEEDAAGIPKRYRLRSLIENGGFRELKQAAYLKRLPRRKGKYAENAAYMHIILCIFAHTLFYAFLGWRKKEAPRQSDGDCLREWRRRESIRDGGKILIIANVKYYAFFDLDEVLDILGVRQKFRIKRNC
ncbi:transposase [Eubacteriales bacterium mix99]